MNAAEAKTQLRDFLAEIGEDVTVRRYIGSGPSRPYSDVITRARIMEYTPRDIVGTIVQGDRKLIVLTEPIAALLPLSVSNGNDVVIVRGRELQIRAVDDNTRRIGGVLIALEIQVRGK